MLQSASTPISLASSPNNHNLSRPPPPPQITSPYLSPSSGFTTPQHLGIVHKRLLIPTVRRPSDGNSPKTASKLTSRVARSASGSTSHHSSPDPGAAPRPLTWAGKEWIGVECKFEILEELELEGYQMYAVEKWVVERTRQIMVLTVYTGDPKHKITVTALSPASLLTHHEAQVEWEKAAQVLRRDGARPRETERGTLMVTSLANFRSDFTIVQIPDGNYLHAREQLWTNINLLRMGCSGRTALTLQKPSETTTDRFISTYNFPDKIRYGDLFNATVLGLVRAVQASLAIFGLFDLNYERNGLLCDATVDGIQKWIVEIGEPHLHVEPMERVADPATVSALLSLVFTMRNKLQDLGQVVPRDPFLEPRVFVSSLTFFHFSSRNNSQPLPQPSSNIALIDAINAAHDRFKQSESYKVHRVLKSKIGDLTTDLRTTCNQSPIPNVGATSDLPAFVAGVMSGGKDVSSSLRYLWNGRVLELKPRRGGGVGSDGEREEDCETTKLDGKSTDEEHEFPSGIHWSGRVQRKIGSWTSLGRAKKISADLTGRPWPWTQQQETVQENRMPMAPTVIITGGEDEYALSSGQVSPVWENPAGASSTVLDRFQSALPTAASSFVNISEYDRKLSEFDQKRAPIRNHGSRIVTWADPMSMRQLGRTESSSDGYGTETTWGEQSEMPMDSGEGWARRKLFSSQLQRRRSFADVNRLKGMRVLPIERMKIDVELCGQLLIMHRREKHLQNMMSCMEQLCYTLSGTNSVLRDEYQEHNQKLTPSLARGGVISEVESIRLKADSMAQETKALEYESGQFRPDYLWKVASPARRKTLELREKMFGTGRRLPQGASGAYGRFNRLQWTLDGEGRLVDSLGRDESEVEEEVALGDLVEFLEGTEGEDEEDVVRNPSLKPTWLLRFFTSWGARWGASGAILRKNDDPAVTPATPQMTPRVQSPVPPPSPIPPSLRARK